MTIEFHLADLVSGSGVRSKTRPAQCTVKMSAVEKAQDFLTENINPCISYMLRYIR